MEKYQADRLEKLSNDKDTNVRRNVADNPNTSKEVLEKLSNDEDWNVRCGIAKNPNTPKETLEKLSNDKDYGVRRCVSGNINYKNNIHKSQQSSQKRVVSTTHQDRLQCLFERLSNDFSGEVQMNKTTNKYMSLTFIPEGGRVVHSVHINLVDAKFRTCQSPDCYCPETEVEFACLRYVEHNDELENCQPDYVSTTNLSSIISLVVNH